MATQEFGLELQILRSLSRDRLNHPKPVDLEVVIDILNANDFQEFFDLNGQLANFVANFSPNEEAIKKKIDEIDETRDKIEEEVFNLRKTRPHSDEYIVALRFAKRVYRG